MMNNYIYKIFHRVSKTTFYGLIFILSLSTGHAQFSTYGLAAYTINEDVPFQVYVSPNPNIVGPNTWTYIGDLNNGVNDLPGRAKDCIVVGDILYVAYIGASTQTVGLYSYDLNNPTAGVQPVGSGLFGTLGDGTPIELVNGISRTKNNVYYAISSPSSGPDFIFTFDITTGNVVPNAFGPGIDHLDLAMDPGYSGFTIGTNEDMAYSTCEDKLLISSSFNGAGGGNDWIAEVNLTNGDVTPIAASATISDGLSYDINGNLFTSNGQFFYVVDETTGGITLVDQVTTTSGVDLESLDFAHDARTEANDDNLTGVYCVSDTIVIDVLGNDLDRENNIDPNTVQVSNLTAGITATVNNITGEITLTPIAGFSGLVSFNYTVKDTVIGGCDDALTSNIATVTLEINTGLDTDGDGVSDSCDSDDDNDGIPDSIEQCGSPAILDWTETDIETNPSNIVTSLAGNSVIINAEVISSSGTNPPFGGDSYNYSGSVSADAGTALNGNVQLSLYGNAFENHTKVTFNITPRNFGDLNLFISDAEETDFVVYAEDASAIRLSTAAWNVTSYEQNGTTPASMPNPYTINGTDISFGAPVGVQNDDAMRIRFDTQTLSEATKIVIETTKSASATGDNVEFMLTSTCPNNNTDNDTIPDYLDIDSDNDGIPDNVEAQPTIGYMLPGSSVDLLTGIWTNYGAGLIPEDTDGDLIFDFLDFDTDNDGIPDIQENDMADAVIGTDADIDGLDDVFETTNINDIVLDVNEDIEDPTDLSILPDTDGDLALFPLEGDLDYRDAIDVFIPSATIDFDGVDDFLSTSQFMTGLNEFTIMAWVKVDASNLGATSSKYVLSNDGGINMKIVNGNQVNLTLRTSSGFSTTGALPLTYDEWYHITATFSNITGEVKLYGNGTSSGPTGFDFTGEILLSSDLGNGNFEVGRQAVTDPIDTYFPGSIDEVRVFDSVLTDEQVQQMVYQEIENNSGDLKGSIIDKNIQGPLPWTKLMAYYPMTEILSTRTLDFSNNTRHLTLNNIETIQPQTAPMPYETVADGPWTAEGTWLHGDVWDIENVSNNKDWSIVHIHDNITTTNSHTQLGMFIDDGKSLTVGNIALDNQDFEINNSWYLELNGTLNLQDDSQLVQGINSDLITSANGKILRRQEGNQSYYWYNYWSSPVGATAETTNANTNFSLDMLKDGTTENPIDFTPANILHENGKVSGRWLYKFQNGQTYYDWVAITPSSSIEPGVGYTQKGRENTVDGELPYLFDGKPNNGTILLTADDVDDGDGTEESTTNNYTSTLIGNPYPSAIDARQFITDNTGIISGTVYVWEQWSGTSHNLDAYEGGYGTINYSSTAPAYQWNNPSDPDPLAKTPTFFIPVAQGFFVEVTADLDNIEFNNGQRAFVKESDYSDTDPESGSSFFRNSQQNTSTETNENQIGTIRLELKVSNGNQRNFVLAFSESATDGYDYGYDARTIDPQPDDMNSFVDGQKMVIQTFSPITNDKVVDLVFNSTGTFNYTIEITETRNIEEDQEIYLRDNLTGTYFDLRSGSYSFSSEVNAEDTDRFDIVFQSGETLSNQELANDDTLIYVNNIEDMLYVKGLSNQAMQLNITNMLGQTIKTFANITNQQLENGINISSLSTGVYVVSVLTENNLTIDKKIIIN